MEIGVFAEFVNAGKKSTKIKRMTAEPAVAKNRTESDMPVNKLRSKNICF